jgi:hypothetical protein
VRHHRDLRPQRVAEKAERILAMHRRPRQAGGAEGTQHGRRGPSGDRVPGLLPTVGIVVTHAPARVADQGELTFGVLAGQLDHDARRAPVVPRMHGDDIVAWPQVLAHLEPQW